MGPLSKSMLERIWIWLGDWGRVHGSEVHSGLSAVIKWEPILELGVSINLYGEGRMV